MAIHAQPDWQVRTQLLVGKGRLLEGKEDDIRKDKRWEKLVSSQGGCPGDSSGVWRVLSPVLHTLLLGHRSIFVFEKQNIW